MNPFREVFTFLLGLLILLSTCEYAARLTYNLNSDLSYQAETFSDYQDKIEILILGTSHGQQGINPEFFTRPSFNLAYSYQDLYYDNKKFLWALDRAPKLNSVILCISPFSFGYDTATLAPYLPKDYFLNFGFLPRLRNLASAVTNMSALLVNHETFIQDLLDFKTPFRLNLSANFSVGDTPPVNYSVMRSGYRYSTGQLIGQDLIKNGHERAKFYLDVYQNKFEQENLKYLENILTNAQARAIKSLVIIPPYTMPYLSQFSAEFLLGFYQKLENLKAKFPAVDIRDFNRIEGFSPDDFETSDHLNFQGSKKLSLTLNKILLPD